MNDFKNKAEAHFAASCHHNCHGCGNTEFETSEAPVIAPNLDLDADDGVANMTDKGMMMAWRRCLRCNAMLFVDADGAGLVGNE